MAPKAALIEISYSRFLSEVEAGNVESVRIDGQPIRDGLATERDRFTWWSQAAQAFINDALGDQKWWKSDFGIPRVARFRCHCWARELRCFCWGCYGFSCSGATKSAGTNATRRRHLGAVHRAAILRSQTQVPQ